MLRTPSRSSANAAVWPHMPPPTTSASSSGLPSGPSAGGTQLAGGKLSCASSLRARAESSARDIPYNCFMNELLDRVISCYSTLSSPWAYLGGPKLQDIVSRPRVRLVLKPYDFQDVVPRTGG